jgi:AAA domain
LDRLCLARYGGGISGFLAPRTLRVCCGLTVEGNVWGPTAARRLGGNMSQAGKRAKIDPPENFLLFDRINAPSKEPEWIFEGLWQAQTFALFTGDGGLGKSHFALQMAVAIASGSEIPGTPLTCPQPRDFVYITQEDEADFVIAELKRQCPELENQADVAKRIRIISTAIQGSTMLIRDAKTQKYLEAEASITENSVIAFDALSTFITGNEVDNTEMQKEMAAIREVVKTRRTSPLLIHHRPKANLYGQRSTFRGAMAIQQPARLHIMLEKDGNGTKLSFEKISRGMPPDSVTLSFDEERRLFVPAEQDPYVKLFNKDEVLTTTQVIDRLGLNPDNEKDRKRVQNALSYRFGDGLILRKSEGKKGQDATWAVIE